MHAVRSWCVLRPQSSSTVGQQRWLCLRRREERTTRERKVWQAMQPDWGSEDDVCINHGANWCVRVRQQAHVVWAVSIPSNVSVCVLCVFCVFQYCISPRPCPPPALRVQVIARTSLHWGLTILNWSQPLHDGRVVSVWLSLLLVSFMPNDSPKAWLVYKSTTDNSPCFLRWELCQRLVPGNLYGWMGRLHACLSPHHPFAEFRPLAMSTCYPLHYNGVVTSVNWAF